MAARIFTLDLQFHRSYVEDVVGPRLLALHRAIKPQSERYSRIYISVLMDALTNSVKEHEAIRPGRSARPRRTGTMRPRA